VNVDLIGGSPSTSDRARWLRWAPPLLRSAERLPRSVDTGADEAAEVFASGLWQLVPRTAAVMAVQVTRPVVEVAGER
jgi:hypothetical protein